MTSKQKAFEQRIQTMISDTKSIGYNPTYFIRMIQEMGIIPACKHLLNDKKIHDGFSHLWELKRLDLTIESIILEHEWVDLFSEEERTLARNKLKMFGYIK